ncbi:MAG: hypothetical protein WCS52_17900 [bacterium]
MRNEIKTNDRNGDIGVISDAEFAQSGNHTAIGKVFSDQAFCEMNVENKLFLKLLLIEAGTMVGTYRNIGRQLFTKEPNVRNWARKLESNSILTITPKSHDQFELRLNEKYQAIAKELANERVGRVMLPASPAPANSEDPELDNIIAIYKTAKATGCSVRVNVEKVMAA